MTTASPREHEAQLEHIQFNRILTFKRAFPVYQISLRKLYASKKKNLVIMLVLLSPLMGILSGIYLGRPFGEQTFLQYLTFFYYFYFNALIGVIISLFLVVSLTSEEITDQTIVYYLHSPVRRADILIWKYMSFITFAHLILIPVVVSFYIIFAQFVDSSLMFINLDFLLAGLYLTVLSIFLYGSLFFFVALTVPRHPLITGLGIALADLFFQNSFFEGLLGAYSISYHIKAIAYDQLGSHSVLSSFAPTMAISDSYSVVIAFIVLFGALAIWQFNRREII